MASVAFKNGVTERFVLLVDTLIRSGVAKNYTTIASLMGQPLQVVSKIMNGERIVTLEQASALSKNAKINADWLITGVGEMFKQQALEMDTAVEGDILLEITRAVSRFELSGPLSEKIILAISDLKKENSELKNEVSSLKEKIIRMLEAINED